MSDVAEVATAEEAADAAVSTDQAAAAQDGTPEWLKALPEHYEIKDLKSEDTIKRALRADKTLARYKTVEDAAKALIEANRTIGQGLNKVPGADATPEEKRAFWDKLGVPADIDGYDVTVPEVDGFSVDDELLDEAKRVALKHGILPSQLQELVNLQTAMMVGAKEKVRAANLAAQEPLQEEWGIQFKTNSGKAQRVFQQYFDRQTALDLEAAGFDVHPGLLRGFFEIARRFGEHGLTEGGGLQNMDTSSAKAKIEAIRKDPKHPAMDAGHRDHAKANEEFMKLYRSAYPEPK